MHYSRRTFLLLLSSNFIGIVLYFLFIEAQRSFDRMESGLWKGSKILEDLYKD